MNQPNLQELLHQQEILTNDLKDILSQSGIEKIQAENAAFVDEIASLKTALNEKQQQYHIVYQEKKKYEQSFKELLFDEKTNLLRNQHKRLARLLTHNKEKQLVVLDNFERQIQGHIKNLNHNVSLQKEALGQDIQQQLLDLETTFNQKLAVHKKELEDRTNALQIETHTWHQQQKEKEISTTTLKEERDRVRTESRFGLKLFNFIGIFFIFLAVIVLGSLTVNMMNDLTKGILLFMFPTISFFVGTWLYKKGKESFAYGLFGGSIGLFYIAIFINYFILHNFSNWISFLLLLLISFFSFYLAHQYRNLPLSFLALIGGYLPLISYWNLIGFDTGSLYFAEIYLLLLNLSILYLAQKFEWKPLFFASFLCMTPWIFIVSSMPFHPPLLHYVYGLLYLLLYAGFPFYQQRKQENILFTVYDLFSILSSLLIFGLFTLTLLKPEKHIANIIMLVVSLILYYGISYLFSQKLQKEKQVYTELFLISFTFACCYLLGLTVIYIPFFLYSSIELAYINAFVLVFAYLLLALKKQVLLYYITAIAHYGAFYFMFLVYFPSDLLPFWLTSILMIGLTLYYICLLKSSSISLPKFSYFKSTVGIMTFIIWNFYVLLSIQKSVYLASIFQNSLSLLWLKLAVLALLAHIAYRIPDLKRFYLPLISTSLLMFTAFLLNFYPIKNLSLLEMIPMAVANLLILFLILFYIYDFIQNNLLDLSYATIILTVIVLLNGTTLAYRNLNFSYLTILMDVLYGGVALGYVMFGFKKKLPLIRRIGLIFMLAVMAKLLLLDVMQTTLFARMLSFFVFGGLALLISYLYQNALNRSKEDLQKQMQDSSQHSVEKD